MNSSDWNSVTFWSPTGVGALGSVAVLVAGGVTATSATLATVLVALGAFSGWRATLRKNRNLHSHLEEFLAGQRQFGEKVTPV